MATIRQFAARLRALFRGGTLDREFAEEVTAHLEMATEENMRRGMTREEARRHATLRLGGATSLQSQHRDARGFRVEGLDPGTRVVTAGVHSLEPGQTVRLAEETAL